MSHEHRLGSGGVIAGHVDSIDSSGSMFQAIDASTGETLPGKFGETPPARIHDACAAAEGAFEGFASAGGGDRGKLLDELSTAMADHRDSILERCRAETGYLPARVEGEFERTIYQLRLFGRLAEQLAWDDRVTDPAQPDRPGRPKPEIRRRLFALGPVAVFGACNFPLAISVLGNDTVAAFAVGCPVVIKSHPGHPGTCELLGRITASVISELGFSPGIFSLVHGRTPSTAVRLVENPHIAAVGFTGSPTAGRALADAAARRERPIPVFAELGSTNPVFVTEAAARARTEDIAAGFVSSLLFGNGQMCTKPGLLVMTKAASEMLIPEIQLRISRMDAQPLLNENVAAGFDAGVTRWRDHPQVDELTPRSHPPAPGPFHRRAVLMMAEMANLDEVHELLHEETFGPLSLVIVCGSENDWIDVAGQVRGSLTATLHSEPSDDDLANQWLARAWRFGGRVIHNDWPTGIEIGPATHHGGPYPASLDGRSTSIGHASLERFVRPVCFQNWSSESLGSMWSIDK